MSKFRQLVFVGLSGGVDSAVAAALLKQATPNNFSKLFGRPTPNGFKGYDVVGIHLRCFSAYGGFAFGGNAKECAEDDAEDARRAAETIGIPFYVFDFETEYKKRVVQYMVAGYRRGITPNPDVMCNKEIKFGLFLEKARALGADYVATGHYVRLGGQGIKHRQRFSKSLNPKSHTLSIACDKNKDQSYFLWTLTQAQLKHCLFPLGNYLKSEVRALARKFNLPNAAKKDSQGICFLGRVTLADFLKDYIPEQPGAVFTTTGEKIGEHRGASYYTIGQRHGLNLGIKYPSRPPSASDRPRGASPARSRPDIRPHYVAAKDMAANTLLVAEGKDNPILYKKEIGLTEVNFINPCRAIEQSSQSRAVYARIRYRQPLFPALLSPANSHELDNKGKRSGRASSLFWKLVFKAPQKFVASGQSAVFYDKRGVMLGGGIIVAN